MSEPAANKPPKDVQTAILEEIGRELVVLTRLALSEAAITIPPAGRSNLARSALARSFNFQVTASGIEIIANSYWRNIEQGRKPGGKFPPFSSIFAWAKKYQLKPRQGQTFNQMVWSIMQGIVKNGIRPRPFVDNAAEGAVKFLNPYLDEQIEEYIDFAFRNFE